MVHDTSTELKPGEAPGSQATSSVIPQETVSESQGELSFIDNIQFLVPAPVQSNIIPRTIDVVHDTSAELHTDEMARSKATSFVIPQETVSESQGIKHILINKQYNSRPPPARI